MSAVFFPYELNLQTTTHHIYLTLDLIRCISRGRPDMVEGAPSGHRATNTPDGHEKQNTNREREKKRGFSIG
jgi:hypothetical protein